MLKLRFDIMDKEWIKMFNWQLYGRKVVYCDVEFYKAIKECEFKFNLNIINRDKSRASLLSILLNGCASLEQPPKVKFLNMLSQRLIAVSNLPKKCPLLAESHNLLRFRGFFGIIIFFCFFLRTHFTLSKIIH